jgi:hypothetical protein
VVEVVVVLVVVVVDDELVVVVGVVVLRVVVEGVVAGAGVETVTVVVSPPHPASDRPAANARAANGANIRLMTLRRGRAVAGRNRDSR